MEPVRRLLLVEADAISVRELTSQLAAGGFEVEVVAGGGEAVDRIREGGSRRESYRLILLNSDPGDGTDGVDVARELLDIQPAAIVFLSNRSDPDTYERIGRIPHYGLIHLPAPLAVVLESIRTALRLSAEVEAFDRSQSIGQFGYWKYNLKDGTGYWSAFTRRICGLGEGERPTTEAFLAAMHVDDRAAHRFTMDRLYAGDLDQAVTRSRIHTPSGETWRIESRIFVTRDGDGTPAVIEGTDQDITNRSASDREDDERNLFLETVFERVPDAVVILDSEYRILEWNAAAETLFGYPAAEAKGRELDSLVVPDDDDETIRHARMLTEVVLNRRFVTGERVTRVRKDGTTVEVLVSGAPIVVRDVLIGAIGVYQDISTLADTQRNLEESLRERELALREIQHRVKNDLAMVSSFLSLQASRYESSEIVDVLEVAYSRVQTMGRVYETLFHHQTLGDIDLALLLEDLVDDIRRGMMPSWIEIDCACESVTVSTKVGISVGVVLNEALTNAMKYAFPERTAGARISIVLESTDESNLRLEVRDNGVGLGENSASRDGFGLRLIGMVADQYGGAMTVENGAGTRLVVILPRYSR